MSKQTEIHVTDLVWLNVWNSVSVQIIDPIRDQIDKQVSSLVMKRVWIQVHRSLEEQVVSHQNIVISQVDERSR
jgi:hypothetical protein